MPDLAVRLTKPAVKLLGRLLEQPDPILSAGAKAMLPESDELIAAGLLRVSGHELVTSTRGEFDEQPVEVDVSDEVLGFGRFSAT